MTFKEITILDIDYAHIDEFLPSSNDVIIPYILSNTPPEEWKSYFEKHAPPSANVKIVDNIAYYKCSSRKAAVTRDGTCWKMATDLVDGANQYYLAIELELSHAQELERRVELKEQDERPSEFEKEWDRYMSRD